MEKKLDDYLRIAMGAADLSNEILKSYFGRLTQVSEKKLAGLVSEADLASEKAICDYVLGQGIKFDFLGEEESFSEDYLSRVGNKDSQGRWIVDPLDGTTNYIYRLPIYCTSIALEVEGEIVVSVIDVPGLGDRYHAVKGGGAFKNNKPIKVSQRSKLSESLLATGFYSEKDDVLDRQINLFSALMKKSRAIRRLGSAAYDLCLVAEGVFEAFWETNLQPWDTAGGMLLVREAGGLVTGFDTEDYTPFDKSILASNQNIHKEIKSELGSL